MSNEPKPWSCEDELNSDGAAEDPPDAEAEDGQDRQQRMAQDMTHLDTSPRIRLWHAASERNPCG